MPSQIEKIQAHTSHLLDAFIQLRERYSLLDPMLFDLSVPKSRGSGRRAGGFRTLRYSLFLSCAQDIAKLTMDSGDRTPNIKGLVGALEDETLCRDLQDRFARRAMPSDEGEDDPELIEELKRIELREKAHRRAQFDDILVRTRKNWDAFSKEPYLTGFRTIRDKVAAHTEVLLVADKYQFVDIGTLGIKWLDMKTAIGSMQGLVKDLGILVRNASFEWDMFDEQLTKTSVAFWSDAT